MTSELSSEDKSSQKGRSKKPRRDGRKCILIRGNILEENGRCVGSSGEEMCVFGQRV